MSIPGSITALAQFFFVALTSIFVLVDPVAAIPPFLIMTAGAGAEDRRRMARRAAWTCVVVLASFAAAGTLIFRLFGITLPAFKIAGGVILLLIGLDMLRARRSPTKETPTETEEAAEKEDVGIIPLGVPMLAGPGSISTVMVLMSGAPAVWYAAPILAAIAITGLASYWILAGADRVRGYLGETGIRILTRMMGLLLTAIAVQFILNGLADVGLVRSSRDIPKTAMGRLQLAQLPDIINTGSRAEPFPFESQNPTNGANKSLNEFYCISRQSTYMGHR